MGLTMGEKIKDLREKSGMTQTELANKVGVSKSVISAYEKGIRNPSYKVVPLIAKVFNVSQLYFFEKGEWQKPSFTVDISDLTKEQQKIIVSLINQFRESNKSNLE